MRKKSSGFATLFMTSLLLMLALIMVMTGYRDLYFQIKRVQNEVQSGQAFWIAQGGLECAYVQIIGQLEDQSTTDTPFYINNCGLPEALEISVENIEPESIKITVTYLYTRVSAKLIFEPVSPTKMEWQWEKGSWHDF